MGDNVGSWAPPQTFRVRTRVLPGPPGDLHVFKVHQPASLLLWVPSLPAPGGVATLASPHWHLGPPRTAPRRPLGVFNHPSPGPCHSGAHACPLLPLRTHTSGSPTPTCRARPHLLTLCASLEASPHLSLQLPFPPSASNPRPFIPGSTSPQPGSFPSVLLGTTLGHWPKCTPALPQPAPPPVLLPLVNGAGTHMLWPRAQHRAEVVGAGGVEEGTFPVVMHASSHQVAVLSQASPKGGLVRGCSAGPASWGRSPAKACALVIREPKCERVGSCFNSFFEVANRCAVSACLAPGPYRPLTCCSSRRLPSRPWE